MTPASAAACRAGAPVPALLVLALALTLVAAGVHAGESLYVIEQLVVGDHNGVKAACQRRQNPIEVLGFSDRNGAQLNS